jgi:ubiquinone/menaquinone biosynthesis C-methylase UbiE
MKRMLSSATLINAFRFPFAVLGRGPRVLEPHAVPTAHEAVEYDRLARSSVPRFSDTFVNMVSKAGLKQARVLDIGSGPGLIPIALAMHQPDWHIQGIDPSPEMLRQARRHAEQAGVSERVRFERGSATALPYPDGSFDLVISQFTLHHIERPVEMLDEAARVVRDGGQVIIKDLARPARWKAALFLTFTKYLGGAGAVEQRMFHESLKAALSIAEVRRVVASSRLSRAQVRGYWGIDFVITG